MTVVVTSSPVFAVSPDDVLADLSTTVAGLSSHEAAARLASHGPNEVEDAARRHPVMRFLAHFNDILIYILLGSAALKAALGEWIDFWVILGVAVINSLIGFIQEGRAESALAGIRSMLTSEAQVRRDGAWVTVPAVDLVPGDIMRVNAGDRVGADARLLEASNLRVEEAALTGESEPSTKSVEPVDADAGVGDRTCMLFSSGIVTGGQGIAVVTATGADAEIGRIQTMLSTVEVFDTPLTRQLAAFGKKLAIVIAAMAVIMVVIGRVIHHFPGPDLISATVGFAVAAIPEGLPALVTITLAMGVQAMARRNAIIRKLPAVETLGSVTRVCSDKTGTLTTNEMTVRTAVTTAATYEADGLGYAPDGDVTLDGARVTLEDRDDLRALVEPMAITNDAVVTQVDGRWTLVGEPTEGALRTFALKLGLDEHDYPQLGVVPFDSEFKYMATLNTTPDGRTVLFVKGAPDRLLLRCTSQRCATGGTEDLDAGWWQQRIDELSDEGLRVLAAAYRETDATSIDHDDVADLVFLGVCGIVDPPRPEAIQAIRTFHQAGITVTMITGDHAGTATAIAREMGISEGASDRAVTGEVLQAATDRELRHIVHDTETFARTSPEHKLRLVKAMQANGEVVAMTGDGVNDAPALRRADVGVAMGIKGTEATKDAAEIVLADDNFATIEYAIEEGRRINDNIHKSVLFLLPTNGAQSLVVLVAVLIGLSMPLAPVQILWVNMVTSITLALAIAYEPAEPDIMSRPPRDPKASLISVRYLPRLAVASVLIAGLTLATYTLASVHFGLPDPVAQTWAVNTLALSQAAYLFNARFLRESSLRVEALTGNRVVWIVIGVLLVLQVAFAYLPVLNEWFGSAPVPAAGWLVPLGAAVITFLVMEVGKAVLRRRETR